MIKIKRGIFHMTSSESDMGFSEQRRQILRNPVKYYESANICDGPYKRNKILSGRYRKADIPGTEMTGVKKSV